MTEITINNQPIEDEFPHNSTINEIIDIVINNLAKTNEIITTVSMDGESFEVANEDIRFKDKIQNFNNINLTLKTSIELAYEALNSCEEYIDVLIARIEVLTQLYTDNDISNANTQFVEFIEIMDLFIQLMTKILRTIRINAKEKFLKGQIVKNLEIHLLSTLKALIPAKQNKDIIMLCDLLEYELMDNLKQWKTKAIPELIRYKDQLIESNY